MMKRIIAALAGLFALALPGAALAQCSGIFTSGYFCGNSAAGGGLAAAASPTAMFDRAFGSTNNSTLVRIGGVWTVLSSANNGVWITSAAGVPSIGATLPNAVQDNITRLGTIVSGTWTGTAIGATFGGTGQTSYAVGDILYAPTTTTVGKLADVATGNAVISGGVGVAPSYGKIGISTHVSGLGTSVATALGVNVGSAGALVVNGGALGTPSSGVATNLTGLPLSGLATQGAFTFVGNNTSGTAVPTAVSIAGLTSKASPVSGDLVLIGDSAASNAWKQTTVGALQAASSVASLNGQTGALAFVAPPQGRLTIQTLTPVITTTQSGKTVAYYTPYAGNQIPLYDGTNMVPTVFPEVAVNTTDTAKNPAAIGASKVNDWFIWNDAGALRLTHGPDWTSDTARSAGTALVMVNGILLNNAAITNGPAASRGTYVGTTRSNGSSQLDFIYSTTASPPVAGVIGVWNMYNRVTVSMSMGDTTGSWSYALTTIRAMNADTSTARVSFVTGLQEDGIDAKFVMGISNGTNSSYGLIGIGLDTTSGYSGFGGIGPSTTSNTSTVVATYAGSLLGYHFLSANESCVTAATHTFFGSGIGTGVQTGMTVVGRF